MAYTIRTNENAPAEALHICLAEEDFELSEGGSHVTENRVTATNAEAHPWLEVEYPEYPEIAAAQVSRSVPYEDDVLAAPNSKAFDADAIREAQEAAEVQRDSHLAIQAGLDQGEVVESGGVAETLAADDADNDEEGNE